MEEQVQQFATVRGNITALLGESKGDGLLQKSMYIFSIGSNDIMEYLFSPLKTMTPEQFVINLTDAYAIHLKNLYSMGARKFGILSIPPIGCCPFARFVSNGFKDVVSACCADKTPFGLSECLKGVHLCKYRDDYLFWDAFHPTEKASKLAATVVVSSQDPAFVSPINFGSLRKA
ncbi:GDSL esterase/lipase At2g23540 [Helianthus annuus]|uniref:GDSL esterase/lipase At2g23540 n=1 Tax=Helianthus annuus TaxID=4232 RepID=UPI0016530650|nr:GDSL esterase/lipase At2g23540 [Helianthus annuus]